MNGIRLDDVLDIVTVAVHESVCMGAWDTAT